MLLPRVTAAFRGRAGGGGAGRVPDDVHGLREASGESEEGKSLDEGGGGAVAVAVLRRILREVVGRWWWRV